LANDIDGKISDMLDLIANGIYNPITASKTGNQNQWGGEGIDGLRALCLTNRTWMSIDSTSYSWWNSQYSSTTRTIAVLTDPTSTYHILKIIRTMVDNCSAAQTKPDRIFTTNTLYNYVEDAILAQQRFTSPAKAIIGFEGLSYKGIDIYWDPYCPANHMFFLNSQGLGESRTLGLKGRTGAWFHLTDWKEPSNQLVRSKVLVCDCVLYCDNPRLQGAYTDLGSS
jgi:hypothetical protein